MIPLRRHYLPAILSLLVMTTLFTAASATRSFWEDESFTAFTAQQSLSTILATDRHVHPPLHYLVSAGWFHLVGRSEIAMRWLSIACIAIAVSVGYALMRRWFGHRAALFFALLIPAWPLLMVYGHTVRYYAWTTMLAMVALLCVDQYARIPDRRWLAGFVLCSVILLYSVYASAAILVGLWLWWLMRRSPRTPVLPWLGANVFVAFSFIPMLATFGFAVQQNVPTFNPAMFARELVSRGGLLVYSFVVGETTSPLDPLAWLKIVAVLAAFVFLIGLRRMQRLSWKLFALLIVVAGVALFISAASSSNPSPQNITNRSLFFLPLFVMLLSLALSLLPLLPRTALTSVILLTNVYSATNYFTNRAFFKPLLTVPWHHIMQVAQKTNTTGDAAILCNSVDYACFYYAQVYGFRPLLPTEWAALAALAADSPSQASQVWWINSNITTRAPDVDAANFAALTQVYGQPHVTNYAPQDPSIVAFKQRFADGDVYEYRVNVWHFTRH